MAAGAQIWPPALRQPWIACTGRRYRRALANGAASRTSPPWRAGARACGPTSLPLPPLNLCAQWLYTTELKRGQSPANALRHALLQWEHNVPSHLVVETLGFWPSQQYAGNGGGDTGKLGGSASLGALAHAASLEHGASGGVEGVQPQQAAALARQPSGAAAPTAAPPPKQQVQQQAQRLTLPVEMDTGAVACAATMVAMCGGGANGQRSGSNQNGSDDSCVSKLTVQPGTPAVVAVPPTGGAPLPPPGHHQHHAPQHVHHHVVHHHHHHVPAAGQQQRARRESGGSPRDAPPLTSPPPAAAGDMRLPLPPAPVLVVDPASLPTPGGGAGSFAATRHNSSRPPHSPNTHSEQSCGLARRPSAAAGVPVPPPSAPLLDAAAAAEADGAAAARLARRPSHDSSTQSRPPQPQPPPSSSHLPPRGGGYAAHHHHHQASSSQHPQLLVVPPTPPMMPAAMLPAGALTPTSTLQQGPACSGLQPLQLVTSNGQVVLASGATPSPSVHQLSLAPSELQLAATGSSAAVLHLGHAGSAAAAAIPVLPAAAAAQYLWQQHDGAAVPMALPASSGVAATATQQLVWLAGPNGTLTPHSVTFVEPPPQHPHPQQHSVVLMAPPPAATGGSVAVPPPSAFATASAHALPSHPSLAAAGKPLPRGGAHHHGHALAATHTADSVQLPPRPSGGGGLAPRTSVSSMSALPLEQQQQHHHQQAIAAKPQQQLAALGSAHTLPPGALPPCGSSVASAAMAQQQQQQLHVPEAEGAAAAQVLTLMMQGGQLVLGPPAAGDAPAPAPAPAEAAMGVGGGHHRPSVAGDNFATQAHGGSGAAAVAGGQNIKLVLSHNQQQALLQALLAQQGISVVM